MKMPWMKFYPADWRGDPKLRMCSLAARGLWIEMIGLMHEAKPYGHLLVSGEAPTDAQLAVLAGTTPDQIPGLIRELESAAVFSRTSKGVVYSRRMTRDEKKARKARENGKSGGNPSLSNERKNNPSVKGDDKPPDKPQKPDTRNQIPEKKDDARAALESDFEEFWKAYPRKDAKPPARKAYLKARKTTDAKTILDGVERYKRSKPDYQDWAMPATWLNAERWADEGTKLTEAPPADPEKILQAKASMVAKGFRSTTFNVTDAELGEMVRREMVTEQQARNYGY